ncbi:putative ABC transporter ATP-binding protein YknY, partial [termite gut metagenome]
MNIEVKEGEFIAVMGPSGCGKSTLLNILGLLDNPTNGEYYLNGTEVSKYTESQRTGLRKGVIGFVFQSFNLIEELNVYENIELPLLYMGIPAFERKIRVMDRNKQIRNRRRYRGVWTNIFQYAGPRKLRVDTDSLQIVEVTDGKLKAASFSIRRLLFMHLPWFPLLFFSLPFRYIIFAVGRYALLSTGAKAANGREICFAKPHWYF